MARGAQWTLARYRDQDIRGLARRARVAAARLLMPPDGAPNATRTPPAPGQVPGPAPGDAVAGMSADVALRDLSLVDDLLAQLESMEAHEGDPDALARLYQLDHLAARMRRNAENLRVLVGQDAGSEASAPTPLIDVIRAAMSSIEQYRRIKIGRVAGLAIVNAAADDLSRLLAELLDNATSYSPAESAVTVLARPTTQGGTLLLVEDTGSGLALERRQLINARFHTAPEPDREASEQTGLMVVHRLASKHGIRVRLDQPGERGTTVVVLLPPALVCDPPARHWFAGTPAVRTPPPAPSPVAREQACTAQPGAQTPEATTRPPVPRRTRNGLVRRSPHSLREFASFATTIPLPRQESDLGAAREQLLTDLGDFSAGERAARAPGGGTPTDQAPTGEAAVPGPTEGSAE